ncbi:MAG TPA: hypothetical protein VHD33_02350, partial [Legionellaceae bacterium]|nr:hypothetical protein [Legionellaceae bacterium]
LEGKIIQFFQQTLEWTNMTYLFYPYFWGRKEKWQELFSNYDIDPDFTNFLRAGSARVVVPVHPAYNNVFMHYLATQEIWPDAPTLTSPLYLSIADELKADQGAEIDDATLQANATTGALPRLVESWTYKLPTTLVHLQKDTSLLDDTPGAVASGTPSSSAVTSALPASVLSRSLHTSTKPVKPKTSEHHMVYQHRMSATMFALPKCSKPAAKLESGATQQTLKYSQRFFSSGSVNHLLTRSASVVLKMIK